MESKVFANHEMNATIRSGSWALLRIKHISNSNQENETRAWLDVKMESVTHPGESFFERFFLSDKAISRLACMASRAGVERECKSSKDVTVAFVAELLGKRIWAFLATDNRGAPGAVKCDGWQFRAESEPPEEQMAVDYKAMDEEEIALEGW